MSIVHAEMSSTLPRLLNTKQVAEALNVSIWTVWRLRQSGKLKCIVINDGAVRFHPDEIEALQRGAVA